MLLLEPQKLANGSRVFPDDRDPERTYFETAGGINVSKFVFEQGGERAPHQFMCEVNFSLSDQEKEMHKALFSSGKTMLIPWQRSRVKVWGVCEDGVKLLANGGTSGHGIQNAVFRAAPAFLPGEIFLTTELECLCSSHASISRFQWGEMDEGLIYSNLVVETDKATRAALEKHEIVTPQVIALRAIEVLRKNELLKLEIVGAGAKDLDQQIMIRLASLWVEIAYSGDSERLEPAMPNLQVKSLAATLPDLEKIVSESLKYRKPILFRLGKVISH